jgi:hypothetical protein
VLYKNYFIYMSKTAKTGIAIVIIIIIVAIVLWYRSSHSGTPTPTPSNDQPVASASASPSASPVASAAPQRTGPGMTASSDASTASLQSDASAIDTQMNGLSSDSTSVDQGIVTAAQ